MRRKILYKTVGVLLASAIVFLSVETGSVPSAAAQTEKKLKETGEEIHKLKKEKEKAKKKVGSLEEQENRLQGELFELNRELSEVSEEINGLETQIFQKEEEIKTATEELHTAEQKKEKQYEDMKKRIRYIYENGQTDMLELIFSSKSVGDFLSRTEYVEALNRYDRKMLARYEKTCEEVTEKKELLHTEKEELLALQTEFEKKEETVNTLIAKTQENIGVKQSEIADAKEDLENYEQQIAKMKAYEEELEKQKALEAKKRAEEARKEAERRKKAEQAEKAAYGKAPEAAGGTVTAGAGEQAMLAAIVECEAGGESYEGQLAVASVIINRVRSGSFPNTVAGVIYQGGQFSPVASGRFAIVLSRGAGASSQKAAAEALSGNTNVGSLYFCRASAGVAGMVIGNHVFY